MTEAVLFVGGSADGQIRDFHKAPERWSIMAAQGPPPTWVGDNSRCHTVREDYRREVITTPWKQYSFYLIDTESPDNLIPLLVEGYARKE